MKKKNVALMSILIVISLTACSNKPEASEESAQNVQIEQETTVIESHEQDRAIDEQEIQLAIDENKNDTYVEIMENLIGEYEYVSDDGKGNLIIEKAEHGYSIDDYESETSYRFLAHSSNIEYIENNRIYIKYPDKVYSDDTVIFCDYILEYGSDEINVYIKASENDEEQFLYCATKKKIETQELNENSEKTSEELLDLFINGSIDVVDSTDLTSTYNISDLNMNSEEWDSYSIGEREDVDNDGENELIICGIYGGIYLDARDNKVYEFVRGDGTALRLSYTYYNGDIWIMYSNSMNVGYEAYHMEKYEGADNLVAEISFGEERIDMNNPDSEMRYLLNGNEISYEEYTAFCSKVFAAEVCTN